MATLHKTKKTTKAPDNRSLTRGRMTRFFRLFVLLTALSLSCCLYADVPHFDNKVVEDIDVIFINEPEDTSYSPQTVLSRIRTKEGDVFSQSTFDNDLKVLAHEFDHVEPSVELVGSNLRIVLRVWPKPEIRSVSWEGNFKVSTSDLAAELGICNGTVFDRLEFNKAFHKLKAFYVKKGFFEAQIDYSISLDENCNEVDIIILIDEGRSGRIKEIIFCGFDKCEEEELSCMMATKEYCFFTSWLTNEGTYNEDMIQVDEFRILNYLQNKGYADATLDIDVCEANECDRILIYINADKGDLYTIGDLSFEGNCLFDDDDIWEALPLCEGDVFSPEDIREAVSAIQALYGRCGYIDAIVDFEPQLIEGSCAYSVHFRIEEGEQFRVGLIRVIGNTCTQTRVILHETLLVPGEVFNTDKLKNTEARLINVGYFKHVNVYPAQSNELYGPDCNYRDVQIEVEETGTGNFSAFGGYSTSEALFGGFNITEKNFDHCGLGTLWNKGLCGLRGGGEYVHFTAQIGTKSSSQVLSWTQPYFYDTQWAVGFDLEHSTNHYISRDYVIRSYGGSLHASYPLAPFLRFAWHYRLSNSSVHTLHNAPPLEQTETQTGGVISASGIGLQLDTTDNPVCPRRGVRSRLDVEYAGIGGDHHFVGFAYLNTAYRGFLPKGVFKFRGDMRYVIPIGGTTPFTLPMNERLFLGGESEVRGYRPYAIGPKFPGSTDPRGGISLYLLSAEYNYQVFSRMDAFVFCDAGSLTLKRLSGSTLRTAAGVGVRLRIMESGPPVMIGYGFPINPFDEGDEKRFFWSLGGRF